MGLGVWGLGLGAWGLGLGVHLFLHGHAAAALHHEGHLGLPGEVSAVPQGPFTGFRV